MSLLSGAVPKPSHLFAVRCRSIRTKKTKKTKNKKSEDLNMVVSQIVLRNFVFFFVFWFSGLDTLVEDALAADSSRH